ncbi:MAG: hypothetical protein AB7O49_10175 [Sphingomonadales bacterium]
MAINEITTTLTLTAAQVHPIFGAFSAAIYPHIPPCRDDFSMIEHSRWEDAARAACATHGHDLPLSVTPAEAWVALRSISVAVDGDVMGPADYEIGCYLIGRLEDAMTGQHGRHTAVDVLAQLDWSIHDLKQNGINHEAAVEVLERVRHSVYRLLPHHCAILRVERAEPAGPTVGEVKAVEAAFAKVGLSIDEAYKAVGLTVEVE